MARMLQQKGFLHDGDADSAQVEERTPGATLGLPRYSQQCQWASLSDLDPDTLTFPGGAPLQLHAVPPGLLRTVPHFYVCTRCGKVFWEGSHFHRVLSMFEEVLHVAEPEPAAAQHSGWFRVPVSHT
uniref:Mut7-C RNAse domain-containing protein n=1 Tax=Tetraodon nigroviridis TaxID=99883 RepID=H3C4I5_TETNG